MKLASVKPIPPTGDASVWAVVFSHETGDVLKRIWLGGCWEAVHGHNPKLRAEQAAQTFLLVAREAERDIAYRMFGNAWPENVAFGPYEAYELKRLAEAKAMCADLFGATE